MSAIIWSKFFWADWLSDSGLRACSAHARGVWMDMLCIAAAHDPVGYVAIAGRVLTTQEIARIAGSDVAAVDAAIKELEVNHVFDRNEAGLISSRRMVRDYKRDSGRNMCGQCGRLYEPRRSDSRYCSQRCKQQAYRNRSNRNVSVTEAVTDKNDNRNDNRNASVTEAVTNDTDNVTDSSAPTIGKEKENLSSLRMPRARARASIYQSPDRILSSGRESERRSKKKKHEKLNGCATAGSLATALPTGALRSPASEVGPVNQKRPHEMTRAEFDAQLEAKRTRQP